MSRVLYIDGQSLTIEEVYSIAHSKKDSITVELNEDSRKLMKASRDYVDEIVSSGEAVYGINTGFGALSNKFIETEDLSTLQYNLIRSHCTGVGRPFAKEIVRAVMLLRANCLASGFSGVTISTVELILAFINNHITPIVPEKGSVGASGDLAPLSHIALCLIGEGEVEYQGKIVSSAFAIDQIGLKPAKLYAKDGLALINGTAVMAALGCLAQYEGVKIAKMADIVNCLTLEACRGTNSAYNPLISKLKPHQGQLEVSDNLSKLLKNSPINDSHHDCGKVQDPYSLRCVPQVHGSIRQTLEHAKNILSIEINSVTDNPLVFVKEKKVISGGNFHGEALALCMDYMAMGLSELGNISERRIEKMMNPTFSDLPAFLVKESGLNSGLMIAHVTAAALASENKYLSHPASTDSIPTSTDKEDHVSMGVTSGRKLYEVMKNTRHVLAIELLCNTQGLEFLKPLKSTLALNAAYELVRKHVRPIEQDRVLSVDIEKIDTLIQKFELLDVVEKVIGPLS